jgi:Protein of unknown function (DUF1566)
MNQSRIRWSIVALISMTLASSPAWAASPAQTCQAAKTKEASKYNGCRQQADAVYAVKLDAAKYSAAMTKCQSKFQEKWSMAEAKAAAQGGACGTVGDQAAVQGAVDSHTTNLLAALGGGSLQVCNDPLGQRLRTGQTTCSDTFGSTISCTESGQDPDSARGLTRSYFGNPDGTITDNRTGLTWEALSDDGSIHDKDTTYTWAQALARAAQLNAASFAGYTDWRLPTVEELRSIRHYGATSPAVFGVFNSDCFPSCSVLLCSCTASGSYWSSSSNQAPGFQAQAWTASFLDSGDLFSGDFSVSKSATGLIYARAVRGGL